MTAVDLLTRAAAKVREGNGPIDPRTACTCEDDGETFTDHWFDRTICPEPCGTMHDVCNECGFPKGGCLVAEAGKGAITQERKNWLLVADWLEAEAHTIASMKPFADLVGMTIHHESGNDARVEIGRTNDGDWRMHARTDSFALAVARSILREEAS